MAALDQLGIEVRDHGMNRQAILGRGFDHAHVADAQQRHVQRARNGRGAHGEHVDVLADLLQPLLVAHAEALLLVDDQQAEIAKLDVLWTADDACRWRCRPCRRPVLRAPAFISLAGAEAGQHLDAHRKRREAALEGFEVLEREHGGGRQHGHLLAVAQRFERRAHGDFGLAEADVAAQQAVHGMRRFHVALDLLGGGELVLGLGEFEGVFEFALPVGIGRKGEAFGHAALGVELEQLVRHVAHFGFDAGFAGGPGGAAQPVERRTATSPAPRYFSTRSMRVSGT